MTKSTGLLALIIAVFCAVGAAGCGQQAAKEAKRDFKAEAEAVYNLCVSQNECYLCSGMQEYEGQNNIGIISLHSFCVIPIEINRYECGQLIEENTGCIQVQIYTDPDGGFAAQTFLDADRGMATVTLSFSGDQELDLSNTALHLCEKHLSEFAYGLYRSAYGMGVINFDTGKLQAFCEEVIGFQSGDYYVDCRLAKEDAQAKEQEMRLLVVYTPLRYVEE